MANEALVAAVKKIMASAKAQKLEEAYEGYKALFSTPEFLTYRPEDQRQALKLMVLAKGIKPSAVVVEAHRAALPSLTGLVSEHSEPQDYEMLGICHLLLGNEESAGQIFRAGLSLERERNPQSDLCGRFMTRISHL